MSLPPSMPQGAPPPATAATASTLTTILSGSGPSAAPVSVRKRLPLAKSSISIAADRLRATTAVIGSLYADSEDNSRFDAGRALAGVDTVRAGDHDGAEWRQRFSQRLREYKIAVEAGVLFLVLFQ